MNSYAALLILIGSTALGATSEDELARCAGIPAPGTRLACYDALAHRPPDKASAAAAAPIQAPAPSQASAPAQPPTPVQPPAPAAAIATDPKNFGLTPKQQHTAEEGPKSIAAHIAIVSSDKFGHSTIVLDSGQTWMVLDDDGRLSAGDAVTIKRAALGSFLMLAPSNHSYRVRRTK
jgi:hypothetical protein